MRTTRFIAFPDQDDWHIGETEFYKRQSRHRAKPSRSRTRLQGPPRCRRKQILNTLHHLGGTCWSQENYTYLIKLFMLAV